MYAGSKEPTDFDDYFLYFARTQSPDPTIKNYFNRYYCWRLMIFFNGCMAVWVHFVFGDKEMLRIVFRYFSWLRVGVCGCKKLDDSANLLPRFKIWLMTGTASNLYQHLGETRKENKVICTSKFIAHIQFMIALSTQL